MNGPIKRVSSRDRCKLCVSVGKSGTDGCGYNETGYWCKSVSQYNGVDGIFCPTAQPNVWFYPKHVVDGGPAPANGGFKPTVSPTKKPRISAKLKPEEMDKVLTVLLDMFDLRLQHIHHLRDGGISLEAAKRYGIKSMPECSWEDKVRYAETLFEKTGYCHGIPGISHKEMKDKTPYLYLHGLPGIMFPIYEPFLVAEGLVLRKTAIQIRLDQLPDGSDTRYLMLSSGKHEGGALSGTPASIIIPGVNAPGAIEYPNLICVTEGIKKALVGASYFPAIWISMTGVSSWDKVVSMVSLLVKALGPKTVMTFYDADKLDEYKENVLKSEAALTTALARNRISVLSAIWFKEYGKGIDDMLMRGYMPEKAPVKICKKCKDTAMVAYPYDNESVLYTCPHCWDQVIGPMMRTAQQLAV